MSAWHRAHHQRAVQSSAGDSQVQNTAAGTYSSVVIRLQVNASMHPPQHMIHALEKEGGGGGGLGVPSPEILLVFNHIFVHTVTVANS